VNIKSPKHFEIELPRSLSETQQTNIISTIGSLVCIGANGSGKSRLGTWIEFRSGNERIAHRIAAQKSLRMPESSRSSTLEDATVSLFYGNNRVDKDKRAHRWGKKPVTHLLDDYQPLMTYLFTEHSEQSILYRNEALKRKTWIEPIETSLDRVKRIWENVLPHRELTISNGRIETNIKHSLSSRYNGAEMSDGERVIFYLIGQSLAAPKNGIIIIDEPELHLHKSIQSKLWDEIESERPDCLFVYLTHDLEFAGSRVNANKIWLKGFDGKNWDWYEIPNIEHISEEVLYTILGSRKPVLFTEGKEGSLDQFIFRHLYPEFTIIPLGSCAAVIQATKSFQSIRNVHNLDCRGIIDRDHRSQEQIQSLYVDNIFPLNVSEIENVLLAEEALRFYAGNLLRSDVDLIVENVKKLVFSELSREKEKLISSICHIKIGSILQSYNKRACGKSNIQSAIQTLYTKIDTELLYDEIQQEVDDILINKKYLEALKVYNNKGLLKQIGPFYGMKSSEFLPYIQRLLAAKAGKEIWAELKKYTPDINVEANLSDNLQ
jgi:hypothetical protein